MIKVSTALLFVCAATACIAQPNAKPMQYYRLSFVISYPHGERPSQTLILDTPVRAEQPGMSEMSSTTALTGQPDSVVQQKLNCTNVRPSAKGLSADVSFVSDAVSPPNASLEPQGNEPIHSQRVFQKQIDLVLGEPTVITQPLRKISFDHGAALPGPGAGSAIEPAPQITVTATAL